MKGATSNKIIIPQAEGYLQVPTIQEGKCIDVRYYYSPEFTSTLLSYNDFLCSSRFSKECSGQLMLNFFDPEKKLPEDQQEQIWNQKLDDVTKKYDQNYGNCILTCMHEKKSNQNIYIPRIICAGLCYTMLLIIPSVLQSTDPHASAFNSWEKAYSNDQEFKNKCDMLSMRLIYKYQQKEHIALIKALEIVPD